MVIVLIKFICQISWAIMWLSIFSNIILSDSLSVIRWNYHLDWLTKADCSLLCESHLIRGKDWPENTGWPASEGMRIPFYNCL